MRCVWVDAFEGSQRMRAGREMIRVVQLPIDRRLEGRSSWLIVARDRPPHLERPVATLERAVKGLLFDCRMCGQWC